METADYIVATDAELVTLSAKGDHQAFEYLFARYKESILRLFEHRLGSRDSADDLLQETFIKVYITSRTIRHVTPLDSGYIPLRATRL